MEDIDISKLVRICAGLAAAAASHQALAHFPQQLPHHMAEFGQLTLEKGGVIKILKMSYVTRGKLNAAKESAIAALHSYGSNHHGYDHLIGPGKRLDTDRYFIQPHVLGLASPQETDARTEA